MNVQAKSYAYLELTMRKIFLCFGLFCFGTSALAQQEDPDHILFDGKTSVVARQLRGGAGHPWRAHRCDRRYQTIQAMADPKEECY